ncbi:MAG: hypothetical protein H0X37_08585 [Herpetosiphonaceae bacterium]|nr:hypothetical protein [Herpetosiphonaceae bacterium]
MSRSTHATSVRRTGIYPPLWSVVILVSAGTTIINLVIARIATPLVHAPADYPSFTWLPLLAGSLGGTVGGYLCFYLLSKFVSRPRAIFLIVATATLIFSYGLPVLPIINPLPRFAGVNWGIAYTLIGMHTVTAVLIVSSILWRKPVP